jgi:IMP and pyridine-specific 5'-nucleotidase
VAPSFNDIRLVLNTAQAMSLVRNGPLDLVTFDGDVTLYDDGQSLTPDNPVIPRILELMRTGSKIGIVTAAGYTEARRYYERLHGLLDAIYATDLSVAGKENLVILGGESNYCFKFDGDSPDRLKLVPKQEWLLKEMVLWDEADITTLLDIAEASLRDTVKNMRMEAVIVRKERAVGIIPKSGFKFSRETLEETVLIAQKRLVSSNSLYIV